MNNFFCKVKLRIHSFLCKFVTIYNTIHCKAENLTSSNRRKLTGSPLLSGSVIHLLLMLLLSQTKCPACLVIVMIMRGTYGGALQLHWLFTVLLIITSIRWKSDDPEVIPQVPISILTF